MSYERAVLAQQESEYEERLRQAVADGLVRREFFSDIQAAMLEAEHAKAYAAGVAQQNAELQQQVQGLRQEVSQLNNQLFHQAEYHFEARKALQREQDRKARKEKVWTALAIGAAVLIIATAASIAGHMIMVALP